MTENTLLYEQVENLEHLNIENEQVDSLRREQLAEYDRINQNYVEQINKLSKDINRRDKILKGWQIGGVAVSIGLVLFLLLK